MATENYEIKLQGSWEDFQMTISPNEQPSHTAGKDAWTVRMSNGWDHGTVEFTLDENQKDPFLRAMEAIYQAAHWSGSLRETPGHIHPDAMNWT